MQRLEWIQPGRDDGLNGWPLKEWKFMDARVSRYPKVGLSSMMYMVLYNVLQYSKYPYAFFGSVLKMLVWLVSCEVKCERSVHMVGGSRSSKSLKIAVSLSLM